jgi:hypothetical protein
MRAVRAGRTLGGSGPRPCPAEVDNAVLVADGSDMLPAPGGGVAVTDPSGGDGHHVLAHVSADSSGADEWLCPECGRHFIVRFVPDFDQLVLVPGDETVSHSGSQHGLVRAGPPIPAAAPRADEPAPAPSPAWQQWMRAHGIAWEDRS